MKSKSSSRNVNAGTERTQHTPGPWTVVRKDPEVAVYGAKTTFRIVAPDGFKVGAATRKERLANGFIHEVRTLEQAEANARLIAAAPELLQAVRNALADLEGIMPQVEPDGERKGSGWQTIEELKAAIKRATGEK